MANRMTPPAEGQEKDVLLVVELYEKNGGRHQTIRVENADIVNAEVIDELKIK